MTVGGKPCRLTSACVMPGARGGCPGGCVEHCSPASGLSRKPPLGEAVGFWCQRGSRASTPEGPCCCGCAWARTLSGANATSGAAALGLTCEKPQAGGSPSYAPDLCGHVPAAKSFSSDAGQEMLCLGIRHPLQLDHRPTWAAAKLMVTHRPSLDLLLLRCQPGLMQTHGSLAAMPTARCLRRRAPSSAASSAGSRCICRPEMLRKTHRPSEDSATAECMRTARACC